MFSEYTIIKMVAFASYPLIVYFLTRKISFFKRKPAFLYLLMALPISIASYIFS
jgi:hypothetical protein